MDKTKETYDSQFSENERLPRKFSVTFIEVGNGTKGQVRVLLNDEFQIGDVINDNSREKDGYRYHDIFHFTFATILGWSPCTRSLMKRKRKSDPDIDEIEDGARATITEEAISLLLFNEAQKRDFYAGQDVSPELIDIVKDMTSGFEVKDRSREQWKECILKAYWVFRKLKEGKGGRVTFNSHSKQVTYQRL